MQYADFVELEMLGRQVLLRVDVDLVLDLGDLRADRARADLQPVRAPGQQRVFASHNRCAANWSATCGGLPVAGDDVAAADVEFVVERQRRPAGRRSRPSRSPSAVTIARDAANDAPTAARRCRRRAATAPAATVPAKPRKFWSGRHTHCTGMRKPSCAVVARHVARFRDVRATSGPRTTASPPSAAARCRPQRRQRDAGDVVDAELRGEGAVAVDDVRRRSPGRSRRGPSC